MSNALSDSIQQMIEKSIGDMHTSIPGKVISYNAATNRAVVKPDLPKMIPTNEPLESPQIVEVPVVWPASGGGKASFTMPLQPGDGMLLNFSQRSMENWLDGKTDIVDDPRQHDLSDCVAIPGCAPGGIVAHDKDVVLKFNNTEVRITPEDTITIGNANGGITIDKDGNMTLKALSINVDTPPKKFKIETHVHLNVTTGTANSGQPQG